MAFVCLSVPSSCALLTSTPSPSSSHNKLSFRCSLRPLVVRQRRGRLLMSNRRGQVVCLAPEEEKMTRRSPLDFPIEWERPRPGRRPDIFPQFSPMKTPLPPPLPADPPEEDEEEEEKKQEEEEDPEKENPDEPEKQS